MDKRKIKFNIFYRFQLLKRININKYYDKNLSSINKLSNELEKLSYLNNNVKIDKDYFYKKKYEYKEHNSISSRSSVNNKYTKKEIKLFNRHKKEKFLLDEKQLFSLRKKCSSAYNNNNKINKVSTNNLLENKTLYNNYSFKKIILDNKKVSNNSRSKNINKRKNIKKKALNIYNNNNSNNKSLNNYFSNNENSCDKNSISKNETNYLSLNIENTNNYNKDSKAFITQQKSENKSKNKIKIHKKLLKNMSNIKLSNFINTSLNTYNRHFTKLTNNNKSLLSGRKNFRNIKYLLEKFKMSNNVKKKLDYFINEDIDIKYIYNSMRSYNNSLKNKITVNKNEVNKDVMITKKNADIINYCDYFYNMDDIYFYKNNKVYRDNYPLLSKKAQNDPFIKDYKKIAYHSNKNTIEANSIDIRDLVKKCKEGIERLK